MKICKLLFIMIILLLNSGFAQDKDLPEAHRIPGQNNYGDSLHVFWTMYPYPFGPPTISDTGRCYIVSPLSFYCDLAGTVEIELVNEQDSVVYRASVVSPKPPYFQLGYWIAGPNVDAHSLPAKLFKRQTPEKLSWIIWANGKRKSKIGAGALLEVGWYLWMKD